MKTSSKVVLSIAILLLLTGGVFLFWVMRPAEPPAEQLIREALTKAEEAAKRRQPAQVIEVISEDFQAGMWNKKRLYVYLLRAMRQGRGMDYDVRINSPRILPAAKDKPNQRVVISRMSAFYSGSGEDIWGSGPLTLVMRRETCRKWLILEEPCWRIVSVANVPPLPAEDLGGF
ncbi:MAG: hypothetical protein OHK0029_34870 [Armatimonadaceae bacterium]